MLNIPNMLTLGRLLLLPVIFGLFMAGAEWAAWTALAIYAFSALTDWFDGFIARKLDIVTPFGTFLDPIADKVFVAAMFVLLAGFDRLPGLWMALPIIILAREFLVAGMREFLGPAGIKLPVTKLAKWKTASQMTAIGILIAGPYIPFGLIAGQLLLSVAAAITVITGWRYMKAGIMHMDKM